MRVWHLVAAEQKQQQDDSTTNLDTTQENR